MNLLAANCEFPHEILKFLMNCSCSLLYVDILCYFSSDNPEYLPEDPYAQQQQTHTVSLDLQL